MQGPGLLFLGMQGPGSLSWGCSDLSSSWGCRDLSPSSWGCRHSSPTFKNACRAGSLSRSGRRADVPTKNPVRGLEVVSAGERSHVTLSLEAGCYDRGKRCLKGNDTGDSRPSLGQDAAHKHPECSAGKPGLRPRPGRPAGGTVHRKHPAAGGHLDG